MKQHHFIGIGAPKCGSTTLAALLGKHPEVAFPESFADKSVDFFTRYGDNYARGIDWYWKQFKATSEHLATCEIATVYYPDFQSPVLIAKHVPDSRLFMIVRDPVRRAYSSFQHDKQACRISPDLDFRAAVERIPKYIEESRFDIVIERFLCYFDVRQLYVLFMEDLMRNPEAEVHGILSFMSLDTSRMRDFDLPHSNKTWTPRSFIVQRTLINLSALAKRAGLGDASRAVRKRLGIDLLIERLNGKAPAGLDDATYQSLVPEFESTSRYLKDFCNRDRLPWE